MILAFDLKLKGFFNRAHLDTLLSASLCSTSHLVETHRSKGCVCSAKLGMLENSAERLFWPGERWPAGSNSM